MLRIIDKFYGDKQLVWNADDKNSLQKAIDEFKERISKGWLAFRVNPQDGAKGEMIKDFDEKASKIIMIPAVTGG